MKIPNVWKEPMSCSAEQEMRRQAANLFRLNTLPEDLEDWEEMRPILRGKFLEAMKFWIDHELELDCRVTGVIERNGYKIQKLYYQAARHRYVTANLYVPDGDGPFPAIINLHGHFTQGRLAEPVQMRGHVFAQLGYVCLCVDAFGSGERSDEHLKFVPHGGLRGGLLANFGESSMGIELADNMRGVDLLLTLPYVDGSRIGATGASGGGNQTMWLTALDERIKAGISVASVGTFESYIMGNNCICETLFGGLEIGEESALAALAAPRVFCMMNGLRDAYPEFSPQEMLRTYAEAVKIYRLYGKPEHLAYRIFDTPHGYKPEILEHAIGFFNRYLKGGGDAPVPLPEWSPMSQEEALVFEPGKRPPEVTGILGYCRKLHPAHSPKSLPEVLKIDHPHIVRHRFNRNGEWNCGSIENETGALMPVCYRGGGSGIWHILSAPYGKSELENSKMLENIGEDDGVLLFDLFASGERGHEYGNISMRDFDKAAGKYGRLGGWVNDYCHVAGWDFHNTSRSLFWLGKTLMGEWVRDYALAADFCRKHLKAQQIFLGGLRDAGVAALLAGVIYGQTEKIMMENSVLTFDWADYAPSADAMTLAMSIPDILQVTDIKTLIADFPGTVRIIDPINPDSSKK